MQREADGYVGPRESRDPREVKRWSCSLRVGFIAMAMAGSAMTGAHESAASFGAASDPVTPATLKEIDALYRKLIEAENRHDLTAVKGMLWNSPNALFVAKTATAAEGNWAGFWGHDVVMQHFADLYSGTFVMDPDFARVRTVGLTPDVAVTYAPLKISVAYAGQ